MFDFIGTDVNLIKFTRFGVKSVRYINKVGNNIGVGNKGRDDGVGDVCKYQKCQQSLPYRFD